MDFYTTSISTSLRSSVPVSSILEFWNQLRSGDAIDNTKLLKQLGIAKVSLNALKNEFSQYLTAPSHQTQLNSAGLEYAQTFNWSSYTSRHKRWEYLLGEKAEREMLELHTYLKHRPASDRSLDQFMATEETVYRRIKLMDVNGDIRGKKILLLGDDDFVSIALAQLGSAASITVLDIDKRILNTIKELSRELTPRISTIGYDAIKPFPKMCMQSFDTVFTDPPYTTNGIELFLSRAVSALNPRNSCSRIYMCFGNSDAAKERFLPVYDHISKSGLMIREVHDKFNSYNGAESIGSTSTLFVLEYTSRTKPSITTSYDQKIYTNN